MADGLPWFREQRRSFPGTWLRAHLRTPSEATLVSGNANNLFTAMNHHHQRQVAQHQASQAQATQESDQLNLTLPAHYGNILHEFSEAFHMNGAMDVP
ncbi:hypothetical protein DL768_008247 [Monosporascus sp. mg162]|nr:hypothetical protein DL768_008247 [Monosporascus sp. mg162]